VLLAALVATGPAPSSAQSDGAALQIQIIASSTFDVGSDGWRTSGDARRFAHVPAGGNPGGHITARDKGDGIWWFWQAPDKFLGDVSSARQLYFDIKQKDPGGDAADAVVYLSGPDFMLHYSPNAAPGVEWTSFSVPLRAEAGWQKVIGDQTKPATQEDLAAVLSSLRDLHIRGEYHGGADNSQLDNVHLLGLSATARADRAPAGIGVALDPPSAMPNQTMHVLVFLVDADGTPVAAPQPTPIALDVSRGELQHNAVELLAGEIMSRIRLTASEPGEISVRASGNDALEPGETVGAICDSGAVEAVGFRQDSVRAPVGRPIGVTLTLTTKDGTPVTDGRPKSLGFSQDGAGRWLGEPGADIPEDQCAARLALTSDEPGTTKVTAKLGNINSDTKAFEFFIEATTLSLAALAAGAVGAFVSTTRRWSRSARWRPGRWVVTLVVGAVAGGLLFLAARTGIAVIPADVTPGWELAVVLGLIGGYLGLLVFDRLADRVLPASSS